MKMEITFTKMHGAGNDFVFIEDMDDRFEISTDDVRGICDRHFGVGADGVILVKPAKDPECIAYMHYINADGTLAQMCGNGVRCFAKFLVDNRLTLPDEDTFKVETGSGPKTITVHRDEVGSVTSATVDMGRPSFDPASLPTNLVATRIDDTLGPVVQMEPMETPAGTLEVTCVSMGNPHAVIFVDDPDTFDVDGVGAYLESNPAFPEKTNVEFAHVIDGGDEPRIRMRVFERGVGETLACGTGCCATAVAAAICGLAPRKAILDILGGELEISWVGNGHIIMTGPAKSVFTGHIEIGSISGSVGCNCRRC